MKLIARLCTANTLRRQIGEARARLFRVALAWSGDAMLADDLVQETLTLGLQRVHQLREPDRLNAWLYSILNNCWKQHLRRQRPHEDLDEERPCDESYAPDTTVDTLKTVERVREAVSRLPLEQRRVLALVDLEGMAYCEVASVLEIPMGTVMSRLHRGRKTLLTLLDNQRQTPPGKAVSLRRVK